MPMVIQQEKEIKFKPEDFFKKKSAVLFRRPAVYNLSSIFS